MRRRAALGVGAAAAAAPWLAGCATAPRAGLVPFIDAHAHLNDPALQIELMDAYGAERAIVFWGGRSDHDSLLDAARRWPGRFVPFASVSPERRAWRGAWMADDPSLPATLDALLASGRFRGIGEISSVHFPSTGLPEADFDPLGRVSTGLLEVARRHRVPIVMHVELTRLAAFSALLERFPDVTVIWAHGGYAPLVITERMLRRHPRLVFELSARTWPLHPRSPEYTLLRDGHAVWPAWLALIESASERFIVGTDAAGRSREADASRFASVQNLLRQLAEPARSRVARENVLALIG